LRFSKRRMGAHCSRLTAAVSENYQYSLAFSPGFFAFLTGGTLESYLERNKMGVFFAITFLPAVVLIWFLTRDQKAASEETAQDQRKPQFSVRKLLLWTPIAGVGVGMSMRHPDVVFIWLILFGLSFLFITAPIVWIVVMAVASYLRNSDAEVDSNKARPDKQKARVLAIGIVFLLLGGLALSLEDILVGLHIIGA